MQLPMRDVVRPSALIGRTNGQLPDAVLVSIPPALAGRPVVRLVSPAARAWRALSAAAAAAGHILCTTSAADSYRPYAVQETTFRARYTTDMLAGRPSVMWQGQRWYQRPGTAAAAVPGTSNHGLGLAVDVAGVDAAIAWLVAHEVDYGWSHELESEPWHIHYWAGDAIPVAVLRYEGDEMDLTTVVPWSGAAQHERMVAAGWPAGGITVAQLLTYTFEATRPKAAPAPAGPDAAAVAAALAADDAWTSRLAAAIAPAVAVPPHTHGTTGPVVTVG